MRSFVYTPLQNQHQAQGADAYTMDTLSVTSQELMERAGYAVFDAALRFLPPSLDPQTQYPFVVFCGKGNNGGDGQICARHLQQAGHKTLVLLLDKLDIGELPNVLGRAKPALIVDALFGTGLSRPLEGKAAEVVEIINTWRRDNPHTCRVLAVDIPSGLSADGVMLEGPFVQADATLTFSSHKIAHVSEPGCFACGEVICKDIGIIEPPHEMAHPQALGLLKAQEPALSLLKPFGPSEHKGAFAHVAVLEGSPETRGASRLAARASLRAGAGLVTLLVHDASASNSYDLPEFMKHELTQPAKLSLPGKISSLIIGPGLGLNVKAQKQALTLLQLALKQHIPVVVDAGALGLIKTPSLKAEKHQGVVIVTPHPGEAARLLGTSAQAIQQDRVKAARQLCELTAKTGPRVIWILKGACPIVAEAGRALVICEGGIPALAVGGSGDVLSGIIAGLTGRTHDAFDTALAAVSAHLAAGRHLAQFSERGHLASDIADAVPRVLYPSR
jgi:hydroxyethylthiazole kinase-like uncharacterized protein yjeF